MGHNLIDEDNVPVIRGIYVFRDAVISETGGSGNNKYPLRNLSK